jgi:hypothetical protein
VSIDHEAAVLGLAAPPRGPVPAPGRPRTQVEPGSLGSGRLPTASLQADRDTCAHPPSPELTAAEWAALQQLAEASASVVSRWPVGRAIALSLTRRGLVRSCSEWVWLTDAGRHALSAVPSRHSQDPEHGGAPDRAAPSAQPEPRPIHSDRRANSQGRAATSVRRAAGGELRRGVLLREPRLVGSRHS